MANITKYETKAGIRYRVRYRKPDGTQTDRRGFRRKIDAEQWAAEHVTTAKAHGSYIDPQDGKATVGSLAPAWLDKKKLSVKASYYSTLDMTWRKWVEPSWGGIPVASVTREDVQQWVARIYRGVKGPKGENGEETWKVRPRSASVVLRAYGILAGILDDAERDRRVAVNPARGVELPRKRRKPHTYLTAGQLIALAGESKWRRDIVLTLGLCGMRWGELVPLRVRDVDLEHRRIYIGVSAPNIGGVVTPDDTKTHVARAVMFPRALDAMMRARCEGRAGDDLLFEAPGRPGEYIRNTSSVSSREDGWFTVALRRAGIPGHMTIHDLRHTAASLMVHAGANVKAVQRQLGHASAAMTLDVYADLFDDDLDALAEAMDGLLSGENVGKMWAKPVGGVSDVKRE